MAVGWLVGPDDLGGFFQPWRLRVPQCPAPSQLQGQMPPHLTGIPRREEFYLISNPNTPCHNRRPSFLLLLTRAELDPHLAATSFSEEAEEPIPTAPTPCGPAGLRGQSRDGARSGSPRSPRPHVPAHRASRRAWRRWRRRRGLPTAAERQFPLPPTALTPPRRRTLRPHPLRPRATSWIRAPTHSFPLRSRFGAVSRPQRSLTPNLPPSLPRALPGRGNHRGQRGLRARFQDGGGALLPLQGDSRPRDGATYSGREGL